MPISVVLKNGTERSVEKTEFQLLIRQGRIMFFERSDGWVVIGRDKVRDPGAPRRDENQEERRALNKSYWY